MAGQNKVMLIGRLTRDPEIKAFQNGGRVASFGLAVPQTRKKMDDGSWEEVAAFVDCKAFDPKPNNEGKTFGPKLAEFAERFLAKGGQVALEGKLILEKWKSSSGDDRQALKVEVENFVLLGNREQNVGGGSGKAAEKKAESSSSGGGGASDEDAEVPF